MESVITQWADVLLVFPFCPFLADCWCQIFGYTSKINKIPFLQKLNFEYLCNLMHLLFCMFFCCSHVVYLVWNFIQFFKLNMKFPIQNFLAWYK